MIPFNKLYYTGKEQTYIAEAMANGKLSGNGPFTKRCEQLLEQNYSAKKALLTHSGTTALEMAALLADIRPGDEFIVPSFTFVATANAFVLRGGVPVWCDIRPDTLNIDENLIEELITSKTKAIVPVHYAGVGCDMDSIMEIARRHDLLVVEDAAQGVHAQYKDRPLGTIGHLGCYSFQDTKYIIAGEGGALLVNDERFAERAEIIREKGTNRSQFFRGMADKYTWVDLGSSCLPSELDAAFLLAQLEEADAITRQRLQIWQAYQERLAPLAAAGHLVLPTVPNNCRHNAQLAYVLIQDEPTRAALIGHLKERGISALFHYIPLHNAPMGRQAQPDFPALKQTEELADRLLRLPLYAELTNEDVATICDELQRFFAHKGA